MTWLDLLSVILFVLVGFLEAKRGAVPAAVDLVLVLLGLNIAKMAAPMVGLGSEGTSFIVLFVVAVGLAVLASWLVDSFTKWDIGAYDSAVAGILGAISGLVLAHGAFHAAFVAGGHMASVAKGSMLVSEVHGLRTLHAIGDMLRNLGGGQTITEKVREQQK